MVEAESRLVKRADAETLFLHIPASLVRNPGFPFKDGDIVVIQQLKRKPMLIIRRKV